MAVEITIPRLGWNMEQGIFVGWLKQDGDAVRSGDPIFTLEGEKATEEIECLDAGILRIVPAGPTAGDTVPVGIVIGHIVQPGETPPAIATTEPKNAPPQEITPRAAAQSHPTAVNVAAHTSPAISPRARRVARELGVTWTSIHGTGKTGRIRERDIRAAAAPQESGARLPLIRKTIAERMHASHLSTAPVTLTTTADATNLVNLRNQFKMAAATNEPIPSYTDFLVKLSAAALARHPQLNSHWIDNRIVPASAVNIGIAVDTDAGLLVPVIRDIASLALAQVTARSSELIDLARRGKLSANDMHGGTFTITNLGAFGIDAFTPIINSPECAVLGVGRIRKLPVFVDDQIVAREQITLSLTFDHRIVDGAPAARFLQTLSVLIENPGACLIASR